ncbi:MAG: capsule assembly Wzi family protein, partial [bacterium]
MKILFLCLWVTLFIFPNTYAGVHESLPTFHWAYDYIDELRVRGYFESLYILNKPFTRGQIAEYLIKINEEVESRALQIKKTDRWILNRLNSEFEPEIQLLSKKSKKKQFSIGTYVIQELDRNGGRTVGHSRIRSKLNLVLSDKFEFYNGIVVDNRLDEDPNYIGRRQSDLASFTEQAYATFNWHNLNIKLGRDFVRFSSGKSGSLMISDHARPMDQLWASYDLKFLKFSFFMANLDPIMVPDSLSGELVRANRFLSTHRMDVKLFNRFYLGIAESIIYGGPESNWELAFLNPFIFYH